MIHHPLTRRNFGRIAVGTYVGAYLGSQSASAQDKLEKKDLTLGFIPMTDCAPLVIAYLKGFFKNNGLNVQLSKEAGLLRVMGLSKDVWTLPMH
jgi:ABC-type nitrate/sulfonate/bicarbonate transport system substrate-binding protein